MTSSLVGSEMCIRDRDQGVCAAVRASESINEDDPRRNWCCCFAFAPFLPVSYTHLTLPTICSV
eukprot:5998723-Prorocentrum_lima.AAC.1